MPAPYDSLYNDVEIPLPCESKTEIELSWTAPQPTAGKTSYYYVRGEQTDGGGHQSFRDAAGHGAQARGDEACGVAVGDEADVMAVGLAGDEQAALVRLGAHGVIFIAVEDDVIDVKGRGTL